MGKSKTTAEFIEKLNKVNPNIEVLGEYVTNKVKILCKCKVDGNEWEVAPKQLLSGHGCPICAGVRRGNKLRVTNEEFINRMRQVNPNVEVLGEYVTVDTKVLCKCKMCGHTWNVLPHSVLSGHGCPICGHQKVTDANTMSHDEFVSRVATINDSIEILGHYNLSKNRIACKCKKCGNEWNPTGRNILNGYGCPKCNDVKKTHEQFIAELGEKNPKIKIMSKYTYAKEKVNCQCLICGHEWSAEASSLLRGNGCPKCGRIATTTKRRKSHESFIEELAKINPNIKIKSRYTGANNKIECECLICGNTYSTSPSHLLGGEGCRICYRKSIMNLDLTEEERVSKRCYPEYTEFINNVLKRDDFTCQLTLNSGNVVVHHLDGYNWCVEKRTDVTNGITLSEDMHKEFHNRYGRGNNTKQQFVEFVNDLYTKNRITRNAYEWVMSERLK